MSQNPSNQAQVRWPSRSANGMDIVQWRDLNNNVVGWFDTTGAYHYPGDGSGKLPTSHAVTIYSLGPNVGTSASSPNLMLMVDQLGNAVGWINSFGIPGGSFANLTAGPIGWIDPQGNPSGSGSLNLL